MSNPSLEHLIREKLSLIYSAELDISTLMTRWWDDPTYDADRREVGNRSYWETFSTGGSGTPPANSITHDGHNVSIGGHWLVWS